jgi:acyl-CoA reductase-like NAD-dependent aldehyde dehydrogenase
MLELGGKNALIAYGDADHDDIAGAASAARITW